MEWKKIGVKVEDVKVSNSMSLARMRCLRICCMPYIDTGSRGTVIGDEIDSKITVDFNYHRKYILI